MSWDFHVRMISERYKRESTARERSIAHFVKGVSGRCLINVVGGQLPVAVRSELPIEVLPYWYHCSDERERDSNRTGNKLGTDWEQTIEDQG